MSSNFTQQIEEQIRSEFRAALEEVEESPGDKKAKATERLNLATRRLYDFVRNRKMPHGSEEPSPDIRAFH
jgi:hypothetical protein